MKATIVIPGAVRTKKNSPNVFPFVTVDGLRELHGALGSALQLEKPHQDCIRAIMRLVGFSVKPSDAFQMWFDLIYLKRNAIQDGLRKQGLNPPIMDPVSIEAAIYRDRDTGDHNGYTQAIGDAIQADRWRCKHCRKKTIVLADCPNPECRSSVCNMELERKGLGIIGDDDQIEHWDGTRRYVDKRNPRVELIIRVIPRKGQMGLLPDAMESSLV